MGDTTIWILVAVGIVVIAGLVAAWVVNGNLRSRRLRRWFGPEYDRTIEQTDGDQERAEAELRERITRREAIELRPVSSAVRDAYLARWEQVQAEFVDDPGAAVQQARALIDEVMMERGYPDGDGFEQRIDLVSVDHPDVVERYRVAHRLHRENREADPSRISTEERRQALTHYRAVLVELLDAATEEREPDHEVSTAK
jgi:hypothetical protein